MAGTITRIVVAATGLTLIAMLFIGSLVGALHDPVPHGIPVGVAAPRAVAQELESAFEQRVPAAFTVTAYPSATAARDAILNRDVDGVLIPGPERQQLLVAGAAGRFVTDAVTSAFTAVAAASGQQLIVTDIRPLPPGDPNGISQLFFYLGLTIPSAGFGIAVAAVLGGRSHDPVLARELRWPARLAALAGFAIVSGAAAAWVADGIIGALPGSAAALAGIGALTAFAVSSACCAAWRLAGPRLAALLILLFVPVGVAAAGGPFGPAFVTSWYAHLGAALPAGAAMPAIRDVVSFNGHALTSPLLVLALWAGIAAIVATLPEPRPPKRRPASPAAGVMR
jgi:hypothetical protein